MHKEMMQTTIRDIATQLGVRDVELRDGDVRGIVDIMVTELKSGNIGGAAGMNDAMIEKVTMLIEQSSENTKTLIDSMEDMESRICVLTQNFI